MIFMIHSHTVSYIQDQNLKWTPLHQAAARGHTDVTRLLLGGKASVQSSVGPVKRQAILTLLILYRQNIKSCFALFDGISMDSTC